MEPSDVAEETALTKKREMKPVTIHVNFALGWSWQNVRCSTLLLHTLYSRMTPAYMWLRPWLPTIVSEATSMSVSQALLLLDGHSLLARHSQP